MRKLIFLLFVLAISSGCSKSEDGNTDEIQLSAGVQATAKSSISAFDNTAVNFANGDAANTYSATPWDATITGTAVTLNPIQRYKVGDAETHLRGYYPVGSITNGRVTYTNVSGKDIMVTDNQAGKKTAHFTPFSFKHLQAQIRFLTVKSNDPISTKVTKITIKGSQPDATLNLADGTLSYSGQSADIVAYDNADGFSIGSAAEVGSSLIQPGVTITLDIEADDKTYNDVAVTFTDGTSQAGNSYLITLTFAGTGNVDLTASITSWEQKTGEGTVQ